MRCDLESIEMHYNPLPSENCVKSKRFTATIGYPTPKIFFAIKL